MFLFLAFLGLAAFLFHQLYWRRRHLPPGPLPLPLIGNIISIFRDPPGYSSYQKWKDQYGPIYSYWLGQIPIVTVNDYKTMQEMFVQDGENYADRGKFGDLGEMFRGGNYGVIETSGPLWREQRRFALHTLRDFGLGKSQMQERILQEADCLMRMLDEESSNGPVDVLKHLERTVGSVINLVVFGFRFDGSNQEEFYTFRGRLNEKKKEFKNPLIIVAIMIPWLRKIPYFSKSVDNMFQFRDILMEFFRKNIEEHKKSIDYDNDDADDFTEAYLKEMHRQRDDPDTTFTLKQFESMVMDLWSAGLDTTSATMGWGTFQLLHNPHVISKMHAEFDRVIGEERLVTIQDKPNLPYANAVVAEVQRWLNLVPQNLLRKSTNEVTVHGFTLPAGTIVSPQISMLLYDPEVFPNPTKFDPERFIEPPSYADKENLRHRVTATDAKPPDRQSTSQAVNSYCNMFLIVAGAFLLLFLLHQMHWKRRHLPPGPTPLPFIGNMLPLMPIPPGYEALQQWKDTFGPVYTYWLGGLPIVTINDYKTIQEMFVKDGESYVERAKFGEFGAFRGGDYGVIETSGPLWREQRRFALHTLRDFGLGKTRMQERILHEAECLMSMLEEESKEGPVDIVSHLDRTVGSVINIVVFGYRFDESNVHEFTTLRTQMIEQLKKIRHPLTMAALMVPWLKHVPLFNIAYKEAAAFGELMYQFFRQQIELHKNSIDYDNDDADDFTEAYLKEMRRQRDDPDTTFTSRQLENMVLDLWSAGLDTTSATLAWGTFILLHNPKVIAAMQCEFDRVIGEGRLVTTQDKPNLPYTNAVLAEIQRWYNLLPQNLMRMTTKDITVNGVHISAGTNVCPQVSMFMYDPEVFPNPSKFDPERFIDGEGRFVQNKYVLPFSVGKRACLGEGLARMELFLFFANLVQRFDISPDPSVALPPVKRAFDPSQKPEPFKCVLRRREVC